MAKTSLSVEELRTLRAMAAGQRLVEDCGSCTLQPSGQRVTPVVWQSLFFRGYRKKDRIADAGRLAICRAERDELELACRMALEQLAACAGPGADVESFGRTVEHLQRLLDKGGVGAAWDRGAGLR